MEVRLLSVGTRGFFLAASRLAIAAQFCRPQREKNLWHQGNITRELNGQRLPQWHFLDKETLLKIILGKDMESTGI